jgi:hypothetical protein
MAGIALPVGAPFTETGSRFFTKTPQEGFAMPEEQQQPSTPITSTNSARKQRSIGPRHGRTPLQRNGFRSSRIHRSPNSRSGKNALSLPRVLSLPCRLLSRSAMSRTPCPRSTASPRRRCAAQIPTTSKSTPRSSKVCSPSAYQARCQQKDARCEPDQEIQQANSRQSSPTNSADSGLPKGPSWQLS